MKRENGNILPILLIVIAVLALAGAAYLFIQNQKLQNLSSNQPSASPTVSATITPTASPTSTPKPIIVYEAEGTFSQPEKDELTKKVINPFTDYYQEQNTTLLTMTIAKNIQASKDTYPYSVNAIFANGGNQGFLVMKVGTGVDWWIPDCMGGCNLTASFKAKYPEIAARVQ